MYRMSQTIDSDLGALDWKEIIPARPDPVMLKGGVSRISRMAAPIISLVILGVVVAQLATFDLASIRTLIPTSVGFWLIFACYYASAPFADWVIFRRLSTAEQKSAIRRRKTRPSCYMPGGVA